MTKNEVAEYLQILIDRTEEIIQSIEDGRDLDIVTNIYSRLKKELDRGRQQYDKCSPGSPEQQFLAPALRDAYFDLTVKAGSRPTRKMQMCLIGAKNYFSYWLSNCRDAD